MWGKRFYERKEKKLKVKETIRNYRKMPSEKSKYTQRKHTLEYIKRKFAFFIPVVLRMIFANCSVVPVSNS